MPEISIILQSVTSISNEHRIDYHKNYNWSNH